LEVDRFVEVLLLVEVLLEEDLRFDEDRELGRRLVDLREELRRLPE
jgi:hypothetical protein